MRVVYLIITALCALLMIAGLVGFTIEGEVTDVAVPPPGTGVGFAEEPMAGLPVSSLLVDAELSMTWEEDVWVGIVTEAEKNRCAPNGGWSSSCGAADTEWIAGGPDTADGKSLTWEMEDGVFHAADGQPFSGGAASEFDIQYTVEVTASGLVLVLLGLLGSGCLALAVRA